MIRTLFLIIMINSPEGKFDLLKRLFVKSKISQSTCGMNRSKVRQYLSL